MPPLFAHDPLDAVQQASHPRWLLVAATALSVACEPVPLALIALAAFAWLERDLRSTLRAWVPFVAALLVALGVGLAVGRLAGGGALVGRQSLSAHAFWGATFAAYAIRRYGPWRGGLAVFLPLAGGGARILLGSHGLGSVAAGWGTGALLGVAAFALAARVGRRWRGGTGEQDRASPGGVP